MAPQCVASPSEVSPAVAAAAVAVAAAGRRARLGSARWLVHAVQDHHRAVADSRYALATGKMLNLLGRCHGSAHVSIEDRGLLISTWWHSTTNPPPAISRDFFASSFPPPLVYIQPGLAGMWMGVGWRYVPGHRSARARPLSATSSRRSSLAVRF